MSSSAREYYNQAILEDINHVIFWDVDDAYNEWLEEKAQEEAKAIEEGLKESNNNNKGPRL